MHQLGASGKNTSLDANPHEENLTDTAKNGAPSACNNPELSLLGGWVAGNGRRAVLAFTCALRPSILQTRLVREIGGEDINHGRHWHGLGTDDKKWVRYIGPDSNPLRLFTCLAICWEGGPGAFEGEGMSLSMRFVDFSRLVYVWVESIRSCACVRERDFCVCFCCHGWTSRVFLIFVLRILVGVDVSHFSD